MKSESHFFEDLYRQRYDEISRYVRRTIKNREAAEDITQEIFFVAYEKREELEEHPNISGWLYLTAHNKILKWYEKQKRYSLDHEFMLENLPAKSADRTNEYQMVEFYSSIENALSEKDLTILRRYYEYGYTAQELADELGITENCFKVRILRMKQKLKDLLLLFAVFVLFQWTGH